MVPDCGVSVGILLAYRRFSEVCTPVDFLTVEDSYYMMVVFPPHFFLSAIMSGPSYTR